MKYSSGRRSFLKGLGGVFAGLFGSVRILSGHELRAEPILGAIRWDAWYDPDGGIGRAVEKSLGPSQFHPRMPFFGQVTGVDEVRIDGNNRASFDKEIAFAKQIGLNYWAYCWYDDMPTFQRAWHLHQTSNHAEEMNWCMIWQLAHLGSPEDFDRNTSKYVKYFMMKNYQSISGAPLLYLLHNPAALAEKWGGNIDNLAKALDRLRYACHEAGLSQPYIVLMSDEPDNAAAMMVKLRASAISNYIAWIPATKRAKFSELIDYNHLFWNKLASTGAPMVPIVMTGWDTRPRKLHPPPWISNSANKSSDDPDQYVIPATNDEIDEAIRSAETYVDKHRDKCPSRLVLIYSWDECDEGGGALVSKQYFSKEHSLR